MLTNSLFLHHYPHLFQYQLRGILVGATLVALSMYPQLIDWKIDYTLHSGQVWEGTEHILATAVYRDHQPIGLYSHRGFAGFTLSIASVLALVAMKNRWLLPRTALPLVVLYTVTLSLAKVRGAMLGMLAGWFWLCLIAPQSRRVSQILILLSLIGILSFGWATTERRVRNAEIYASTPFEVALKHFTSDRVYLWQKAWIGFLARPWFGWGFSGYSIANATQLCPEETNLVAVEDYYAYCRDVDGNVIEMKTESTKAHNLVLDQYVSLGLFGASSYFLLLGYYFLNLSRTSPAMLSASVTYIIYALTWYDSGQFSHVGWWIFSVNFLNRNV
ncbi:MAG: hypothetical protein HC840_16010 [Leptolyngbyaceae cyanobacterium RM2_2_4]|nr:hypothetical protein [Leptolyngbyaceae cyanobacterium RM2_2_4]